MFDLVIANAKLLNLGMPLVDVLQSVTLRPAELLGISDRIGKIEKGYDADIVICNFDESVIKSSDADGNIREGKKGFVPEIIILKGEKVFCTN